MLGNDNTFRKGKSLKLYNSILIKILYRTLSHDLYLTSDVTCHSYDEYCTCCTEIYATFCTWYWLWLYCKNISAVTHNKMYHPQSFLSNCWQPSKLNCHSLPWTSLNCHELLLTTINYHEIPWTTINYHELLWTAMNYNELAWITMNYHKPQWTTMNCHELPWTTMNCL